MKKISMLAMALVFCLNLISAECVRAEVMEEIVMKDNRLVVYKVEKIRKEIENYTPPPFEVPDEKLFEIRNILKKGEGEYVFKETAESKIIFGFPVKEQNLSIVNTMGYKDKSWSPSPDRANLLSEENQILSTLFLLAIAIGILAGSLLNQRESIGDKKLFVFYAGILFFSALLGYAGSYRLPSAYAVLGVFVCAVLILVIVVASVNYFSPWAGVSSLFSLILALVFFASGQGIEFVAFLVAWCTVSYILSKIAKRIFWSKNEPQESNVMG